MRKDHTAVLLGCQKGAKKFAAVVDRYIHFYVVYHAASPMYHAPVLRKSAPVGSRAGIAHRAFLPRCGRKPAGLRLHVETAPVKTRDGPSPFLFDPQKRTLPAYTPGEFLFG